MKPKAALIILLIFAVLTGVLTFFVIRYDKQRRSASFDQSMQKDAAETRQKTEEELREEKRLEMLRILDQNKEADTMTPEEKEKKRLEMLEVLNKNKEADTMTPEEKEKKRLEMLEILNREK